MWNISAGTTRPLRRRAPGKGRPRDRARSPARPRPEATAPARPRPTRSRARAGAASPPPRSGPAPTPSRPPPGSRRADRRTGPAPPRSARASPAARRASLPPASSPSAFLLPKKTGAPFGAPPAFGSRKGLDRLHVRRLQALIALHDVELDLLTLGQRLVAFPCNRREVDEDVFAAFALDEAVALLVREPLDGALGQNVLPSYQQPTPAGARSRRPTVKRRER